ncbi:MAG: hypothetical protein A2925_04645 [Candidatus Yanofskybacteria bacterium RIFCSPLOWO2_01_FULL_44_22]|uniref:DUF2238 domain-containing protein n=2 Tax=Candidatus Yanofskyibacteriota TaxID=1752733 RepID=A0A1F8GKX7_9BACT|nr:MAG: hypothetical protein A2925_04645 [Candidatus Yanofskybacteria bacterium RIFCSPLOWO2_01_FULL_44_22]
MKRALLYLSLLFASNVVSMYYSLYIKWWWFDAVQHFLGGFFIAMLIASYLKDHMVSGKTFKNMLVVTGATALIGVFWEFTEYTANQTLPGWIYEQFQIKTYFIGDLKDTLSDLFLDIAGAACFYGLHLLNRRNSHESKAVFENKINGPTK